MINMAQVGCRTKALYKWYPRGVAELTAHISKLNPFDIVSGRGMKFTMYTGDWLFRQTIVMSQAYFSSLPRENKSFAADYLLEFLVKHGFRFVERKKGDASVFHEIPFERAREKVCQALREKRLKKRASPKCWE